MRIKLSNRYKVIGSVYSDREMEEFYVEQHEYNDSDGGGNDYHDWMSNTNDFPKPENLERPKVRLDRLDETIPVIPSYEVTWVFSLPKDEYHGDYPDEEYVKTHGI